FEQHIGKGRQHQPPLVGPAAWAGGAVGEQIQLLVLDPILHVATAAVVFVVLLGSILGKAGHDDEAWIGTLLAMFQARHNQAAPTPTTGLIEEAIHAGHLLPGFLVGLGDRLHGRRRHPLQAGVAGQTRQEEIDNTIAVMGGEDWKFWIEALKSAGVLAEGVKTVAYSYIGPELTYPIYRNGTIGKAKDHLEGTVPVLNSLLQDIGGVSYVSVNKALVTQSSSAIPVVPLYISL